MSKRRITVFAVLAAFILIAAVAATFILAGASGSNVPPIVLPPEVSAEQSGPQNVYLPTPPKLAEITPDNVADVVLALSRPTDYYTDIEVQLFWDSGSAALNRKVWATDGAQRVHVYDADGNESEHRIIAGDLTYVWQAESKQYSTLATGEFSADDAAYLPTYEDLIAVAPSDILNCGFVQRGDIPCLYAETQGDGDTRYHWWVTLDSGLLWAFEAWQNDAPTRVVRILTLETGAVNLSQFVLPDGNSVLQ